MGRDQELIEAARSGNYAAVDRILSSAKPKRAGPFASLRRGGQGGVGARDVNGYTALHYAALNGHKEVVRLLLSYEASTNRYF
jgi:ankyrin repeat protein